MSKQLQEIRSYLRTKLFHSAMTNGGLIAVNSKGVLIRANVKRMKIEWMDGDEPRYYIGHGRATVDSVRNALAMCEKDMHRD